MDCCGRLGAVLKREWEDLVKTAERPVPLLKTKQKINKEKTEKKNNKKEKKPKKT